MSDAGWIFLSLSVGFLCFAAGYVTGQARAWRAAKDILQARKQEAEHD